MNQQAAPSTSSPFLSPQNPLFLLSLHILAMVILNLSVIPNKADQFCLNDRNFTSNSDFAQNRALVLSSLASNVAENGGYYSLSVGTYPYIVFVIGLCRGDMSKDTCFEYMNSTAPDVMVKCPNQTQAFSWGTNGRCFIRYLDVPLYGVVQLSPQFLVYDTGNITMNLDQFDSIWNNWTRNLVVNASMGSLNLKFAAGTLRLPNFVTLYGYTQCSPDLSQTDCDACLMNAIDTFTGNFHGHRGGVVWVPSCQFQWEPYPVMESVPPPPPPPPSAPFARPSTGTPT